MPDIGDLDQWEAESDRRSICRMRITKVGCSSSRAAWDTRLQCYRPDGTRRKNSHPRSAAGPDHL